MQWSDEEGARPRKAVSVNVLYVVIDWLRGPLKDSGLMRC